jgi:hypothetical protein
LTRHASSIIVHGSIMNSCHKRYFIASLALALLLVLGVSKASAQTVYGVLYETFTNSFDLCPAPNTFDQQFKSTLSSKGSKVIHLNHHVANLGDPMAQLAVGSTQTDWRLANTDGSSGTPVFESAVNRTDFGGVTARLSPTQSEWESRIDQEVAKSRSADITYVKGSYDPFTRKLSIMLDVTSDIAYSDSVKIRYAILQDNISYAQCSGTGPTIHNNVVRYITLGDSVLSLTGKPSGTTVRVIYNQTIGSSSKIKLSDLKLVAFIEETSTGDDYHVTSAGQVLKDFDTLKPPPQSLTLLSSSLDGQTFTPNTNIKIQFSKLNVSSVSAYYSLDNGKTWTLITSSTQIPIDWTVPDSATTTGKIKLQSSFDSTVQSIETGTFTIARSAKSFRILRPTSKDTLQINQNFRILWTKQGVPAVNVLLTRNGGIHFDTLARGVTDTMLIWKVNGPSSGAANIVLIATGGETTPVESDPFIILTQVGVAAQPPTSNIASIQLYPNPAQGSNEVRLTLNLTRSTQFNIELYDVLGRLVNSTEIPRPIAGRYETAIDTHGLSAGTYTVRIVTDQGDATSSRLVIAH